MQSVQPVGSQTLHSRQMQCGPQHSAGGGLDKDMDKRTWVAAQTIMTALELLHSVSLSERDYDSAAASNLLTSLRPPTVKQLPCSAPSENLVAVFLLLEQCSDQVRALARSVLRWDGGTGFAR
jgi:hypothetical protein